MAVVSKGMVLLYFSIEKKMVENQDKRVQFNWKPYKTQWKMGPQ